MTGAAELPAWAALVTATLLLLGAAVTLIGSLGLLRLRSFYERVHAPTLGTTLGTGCIVDRFDDLLLGPAVPARAARAPHHRFRTVTTPVTLMVLVRAALLRAVRKCGWRSRPGREIGPRGGLRGDIEHLPGRPAPTVPRRGAEREPAEGARKANVTSLLERTSRFTLLPPNGDRRSAAVLAGVAGALRPRPRTPRRAITFGRGSGSAGYAALDRHPT